MVAVLRKEHAEGVQRSMSGIDRYRRDPDSAFCDSGSMRFDSNGSNGSNGRFGGKRNRGVGLNYQSMKIRIG